MNRERGGFNRLSKADEEVAQKKMCSANMHSVDGQAGRRAHEWVVLSPLFSLFGETGLSQSALAVSDPDFSLDTLRRTIVAVFTVGDSRVARRRRPRVQSSLINPGKRVSLVCF